MQPRLEMQCPVCHEPVGGLDVWGRWGSLHMRRLLLDGIDLTPVNVLLYFAAKGCCPHCMSQCVPEGTQLPDRVIKRWTAFPGAVAHFKRRVGGFKQWEAERLRQQQQGNTYIVRI